MKSTEDGFTKVIVEYIDKTHTESAVLITGDWNSSKKFYWNSVIEPVIKLYYLTKIGRRKLWCIVEKIILRITRYY